MKEEPCYELSMEEIELHLGKLSQEAGYFSPVNMLNTNNWWQRSLIWVKNQLREEIQAGCDC